MGSAKTLHTSRHLRFESKPNLKMGKKKICNLIILDASGSMSNKAEEVRHVLKELFKDIRESSDVKNHTIVYDFASAGDSRILVNSSDQGHLSDEIADAYTTRGLTALYDAIAESFALVKKGYDGVFVNIMTDGLENNSRNTSLKDVKKLITKKRKKGWAVTFMGTTEEALKEAMNMGISGGNTFQYSDSKYGTKHAGNKRIKARERYQVMVQDESLGRIQDELMDDA